MASHASVAHAHAAPTGLIRKYIFSLDHKVIGIQYYFLALFSVFLGMALSVLMRIHLVWPNMKLPFIPGGHDDARAIPRVGHHARHDHGVHGAHHRAAVGLRQLFSADSNRRRGHGVSRPQHAFLLDNFCFAGGDGCRVLRRQAARRSPAGRPIRRFRRWARSRGRAKALAKRCGLLDWQFSAWLL